jgi:hypothetical protein
MATWRDLRRIALKDVIVEAWLARAQKRAVAAYIRDNQRR